MQRQPQVSEIKSLFERWTRQEDARREQQEWLKDFFAEAKGRGFNSKALRAAFAEQYRLDHEETAKREKRLADEGDVDLYLAALGGLSHACEEPEPLPPDPAAQEGGVFASADGSSSGRTEPSADGQPIHAGSHVATDHGDEGPDAADDSGSEPGSVASASGDNSPETATRSDQTLKSTAARDDAGNTGVTAGETATNFLADLTGKPAEPSAPTVNPRCLKAQKGEDCWMAHKTYCCADCTSTWTLNRQQGKRVPA